MFGYVRRCVLSNYGKCYYRIVVGCMSCCGGLSRERRGERGERKREREREREREVRGGRED